MYDQAYNVVRNNALKIGIFLSFYFFPFNSFLSYSSPTGMSEASLSTEETANASTSSRYKSGLWRWSVCHAHWFNCMAFLFLLCYDCLYGLVHNSKPERRVRGKGLYFMDIIQIFFHYFSRSFSVSIFSLDRIWCYNPNNQPTQILGSDWSLKAVCS